MKRTPVSFQGRPFAFALVVAFVGLFAAFGAHWSWQVAHLIWDAIRIKSWVAVPATIQHVELRVVGRSRKRYDRVFANYTYEFAGARYQGSRISVPDGGSYMDNFHRPVYRELEKFRREGTRVRCYVNPNRPQESVLYPDLRWSAFVGMSIPAVAFTSIGLMALVSVWRARPWAKAAPT
jgi:hypothetical protein